MKPQQGCSTAVHAARYVHRQHYCGTCKAIGQAYGQPSRMLLNFDGVFLAELLTELHQESVEHWEPRLQRANTCLTMPTSEAPFALRYAGAAIMLFSALSLEDQLEDRSHWSWRWTQRFYNKAFHKALQHLEVWDVDVAYLKRQAKRQRQLEQQAHTHTDLSDHLLAFSQPTAAITAHVFGRSVTDADTRAQMEELGTAFGRLLYILDAFEDYEKDVFKGEFNPLALYWGKQRTLSDQQLEAVRALLLDMEQTIGLALQALPLEAAFAEQQRVRLSSNLALRLYVERKVPLTRQERLAQRYQQAKNTAAQWLQASHSSMRQLQYYLVVLAVFVSPQTKAYLPQDGKLETVGWMTFATALLASMGWVRAQRYGRKAKRKEKRQRRRFKRWWKKLRQRWARRNPEQLQDSCGACCSDCCGNCCSSCCESCVDGSCDCCCDRISESENPILIFLLMLFVVLVVIGFIVLLVIFA